MNHPAKVTPFPVERARKGWRAVARKLVEWAQKGRDQEKAE